MRRLILLIISGCLMVQIHAQFHSAGVTIGMGGTIVDVAKAVEWDDLNDWDTWAMMIKATGEYHLGSGLPAAENPCYAKRFDCNWYAEDVPEYFSGREKILIISDYQVVNRYSYPAFRSFLLGCENDNIDILYMKPDYPEIRNMAPGKYDKIYAMSLSDELATKLKKEFSDKELIWLKEHSMGDAFHLPVYQIKPLEVQNELE